MAAPIVSVALLSLLSHASCSYRKPEEFACDIEQKGYHIVGSAPCGLKVWRNSKSGKPFVVDFMTAGVCEYEGVSSKVMQEVWKVLGIRPREDHQPGPTFFTPQGERVMDVDRLTDMIDSGHPLFLIEGGQFQWPPVKIGFRAIIEGIQVGGKPVELETLALNPPIFQVHNLASREETDALIEYAKPHFVKADVVYMDKDKGKDVDEFRTSLNYRPAHNETPLLATMEARATQVTRTAFSHLEPVQILHYKKGGYYHAHDDAGQLQFYIQDKEELRRHHYGYFDRMLTLFWYMNDVPKGGETNFPRAGGPNGEGLPMPQSMRQCMQGLMVKPVAGQAVLWYNMGAHGLQTPYALHAACAVEEGEKYAINIWIYNKPMSTPPAKWDPIHPRVRALERLAGRRAGTGEPMSNNESKDRSIEFVNKGEAEVQIYWKGGGVLQPMMDPLGPGKHMQLASFVGHTFVAKSGEIEVGSYTVTANGGQQQTFQIAGRTEL